MYYLKSLIIHCFFSVLLLLVFCYHTESSANPTTKKACLGTNMGIGISGGGANTRYWSYRNRYRNCSYVDGNLEITFLDEDGHGYDLSFLRDIEEVTGYVLIFHCFVNELYLNNLRVIRGRTLFVDDTDLAMTGQRSSFSLMIVRNYISATSTTGLKELQFVSLREIANGHVFIADNGLLCFDDTIAWNDIITGEGARFINYTHEDRSTRNCGRCDGSCVTTADHVARCWGKGRHMCQTLTQLSCSPQCDNRCFGPEPAHCCHQECAGGCTGPKNTDCWACKNFKNGNFCEPYCPPDMIYDQKTFRHVPNPNKKYAYGTLCVDVCPDHLIADKTACVSHCGAGRTANKNRECTDCNGPCPKTCQGNEPGEFVHAGNIDRFSNCTIVEGNLRILENTLKGVSLSGIPPLDASALWIFRDVQEITEFLSVEANQSDFKDLAFLQSLHIIHGRKTDDYGSALKILGTSLESLQLKSLEEISSGWVMVVGNPNLCYVTADSFRHIMKVPEKRVAVARNRNQSECAAAGISCSPECSSMGCWGQGDNQCISCEHYRFDGRCIPSCRFLEDLYEVNSSECRRCHKECLGGCSSEGSNSCVACRNVQDGPYCVEVCPASKYPNESGSCQPCSSSCDGNCTGPGNFLGYGGCTTCGVLVFDESGLAVSSCLPKDTLCDLGYYQQPVSRVLSNKTGLPAGTPACFPCYRECLECSGPSRYSCSFGSCRNWEQEKLCVPSCGDDYYEELQSKMCHKCDQQCIHCTGPTSFECVGCRHLKIFLDDEQQKVIKFNCSDHCPDTAPHKTVDRSGGYPETVCITTKQFEILQGTKQARTRIIIAVVFSILFSIIVIIIITCVIYKRKESRRKTKERLLGVKNEPLTPTDKKPDIAQLRIINVSELRRGNMIGSGAFGTVFKGFWLPAKENVRIPVAIKELQQDTCSSQKSELLDEARVMASVVNVHCIRLLGVCMTASMQLVTQLMPLGSLLDYLRDNRHHIGSQTLLNWSKQIAVGMRYLESQGIVHRDLAARNVLVKEPHHVVITDFGLAKLLDFNETDYTAPGGKMPIKWLALECIQHRIFNHRTDVWSYGVTLWELFTFGDRPYDNVPAREIPMLLAKGERLSQPPICTIDVYMIMIKCWSADAATRPSFKELEEEFSRMSRDPGRYLVIEGDSLMRLPTNKYTKNDFLRNVSMPAGGSEELMTADEYLMPAKLSHGGLPNISEDNEDAVFEPDNAKKKEKRFGWRKKSSKKGEEESVPLRCDAADTTDGSLTGRYTSDPTSSVRMRNGPSRGIPEGDLDVQVPGGDDEGYLQPEKTKPAAYMDLSGSQDYLGPDPALERTVPAAMNPEYFDEPPSEPPPAATVRPSNSSANEAKEAYLVPDPTNTDYYNDGDVPVTKRKADDYYNDGDVITSSPHNNNVRFKALTESNI